jgi:hypothetical protein
VLHVAGDVVSRLVVWMRISHETTPRMWIPASIPMRIGMKDVDPQSLFRIAYLVALLAELGQNAEKETINNVRSNILKVL